MRNPPGPYKHDDPVHRNYGKSGDGSLLAKKRQNFASGGSVLPFDDDPDYNPYRKGSVEDLTNKLYRQNLTNALTRSGQIGKMLADGTYGTVSGASGSSGSSGSSSSSSSGASGGQASPPQGVALPESVYKPAKPISNEDNPSIKATNERAARLSANKTTAKPPPEVKPPPHQAGAYKGE